MLKHAKSSYLRAHQDNPVYWQEWNERTLERARIENKLIFLSIGYHTCHWCHVMNDESFSNETIARALNDKYIPVKLDREERPDVDAVYMMYLQATMGHGGWPLNVFLAPGTLNPVFGGTYWPGPESARDGPKFGVVLDKIHELWTAEADKCLESSASVAEQLKTLVALPKKTTDERLGLGVLTDAHDYFARTFDSVHGGFGGAPKFPNPTNLAVMVKLSAAMQPPAEKVAVDEPRTAAEMAVHTLRKLAAGGIRDHVGQGFARYSVTADWSVPHFEKMLYDQAQLLDAFLNAYVHDRGHAFALDCVRDIAGYLTAGALAHPAGGFYSAEDADSYATRVATVKTEGAYYVWTYRDFFAALDRVSGDVAAEYYGVSEYGNVDPDHDPSQELKFQNVLRVSAEPAELAAVFGMTADAVQASVAASRLKLRAFRDAHRPPPERDTKLVTAWNGLAVRALARAAVCAPEAPEAASWLASAERAAAFVRATLYDGRQHRLVRAAFAGAPGDGRGLNEDYAYLIAGLIELYQATFKAEYLAWAKDLQDAQIAQFWDPADGGFFSAAADTANLIFRMKTGYDTVEPSANGVSIGNLNHLATMLDGGYDAYARQALHVFAKDIQTQPDRCASMLEPVLAHNSGLRSVVIASATPAADAREQDFLAALRSRLLVNTSVVRVHPGCDLLASPALAADKRDLYQSMVDRARPDETVVYMCQGQSCSAPITSVGALEAALE
ncbi:uncharacterized protein V1510DRAFT_404242 [Dipodascopsis tothii]|uniref:uncharacterized protein n=1 Tax=Dipodascopsis tothii TaxID=44089 RepID=UPI0034CEC2C0